MYSQLLTPLLRSDYICSTCESKKICRQDLK